MPTDMVITKGSFNFKQWSLGVAYCVNSCMREKGRLVGGIVLQSQQKNWRQNTSFAECPLHSNNSFAVRADFAN